MIMENRAHALIAGLFTLLLGSCVIAALWWFGGKHETVNLFLVVTERNVTGLNLQAQVRYRGIRVGKVEAIRIDPQNIRLTLIRISLRSDIPITRGTTARLGYQGVTGLAHILLEDSGKDPVLLVSAEGEPARIPMQDSLIQEFADTGSEVLRNTRELLASANALLGPDNRRKLMQILSNLEDTTGNAREATDQLRLLLTPKNVRLLNSLLEQGAEASGQLNPLMTETRHLVARLQSASERLDGILGDPEGTGAAALLPRLNELGSELTANSRQLNRILGMLEESPQSLIFGPPKSQPGPGEAGFSVLPRREGSP